MTTSNELRWLVVLATLALSLGCNPDSTKTSGGTWRSTNFNVSAELPPGWIKKIDKTPGRTYDNPDELLVVFVNKKKSLAFLLNIITDPKTQHLSDEDLLEASRARYESNPAMEFRQMSRVKLHGRDFGRLLYSNTEPDGMYVVAFYITRDEERTICIQYMYEQSSPTNWEPPTELEKFNSNLNLSFPSQ